MQRDLKSVLLLWSGVIALVTTLGLGTAFAMSPEMYTVSDYWRDLIGVITGDWQRVGEVFLFLQGKELFMWGFILS